MSLLIYNGIVFDNIKTKQFKQAAVYSEDGCDYLMTAISIEVSGVWSPHSTFLADRLDSCPDNIQGTGAQPQWRDFKQLFPVMRQKERALAILSAEERIATLRESLLTPRRELYYSTSWGTVGNIAEPSSPLIHVFPTDWVSENAPSATALRDARNGPKPEALNITEVVGTESCFVSFTINTWITDEFFFTEHCSAYRPGGTKSNLKAVENRLLSNRWSEKCTLDELGNSTIVRTGVAYLRTQPAGGETDGFVLRSLVTPDLRTGFVRGSCEYSLNSANTELNYSITDKQAFLMSRDPTIRKVEGTLTVNTPFHGIRSMEVTVEGEGEMPYFDGHEALPAGVGGGAGSRASDEFTVASKRGQQILLNYIVWVAVAKITSGQMQFMRQGSLKNLPLLESMVIKQSLFQNKASVTIKAKETTNQRGDFNPLRAPTGWIRPEHKVQRLVTRKYPLPKPPVMGCSPLEAITPGELEAMRAHKVELPDGTFIEAGAKPVKLSAVLKSPQAEIGEAGILRLVKGDTADKSFNYIRNAEPLSHAHLEVELARLKNLLAIFSGDANAKVIGLGNGQTQVVH